MRKLLMGRKMKICRKCISYEAASSKNENIARCTNPECNEEYAPYLVDLTPIPCVKARDCYGACSFQGKHYQEEEKKKK